jgi:hypothetical protein
LAALVDRSLSAADAIGETASKIGIGVEALQELRFAASLAGVEQQTLDMALQRFVRRVAEATNGTGEAKDALARMGITLRDQSGSLRRSEDLLGDVADAFARIEDPAERVRLAFKLFDSEGVALINLLQDGSGALEEMRERARALGIVLDEDLVRDAGRARDELDTLAQVISANLTRAALEAAPVIADLSGWLAERGPGPRLREPAVLPTWLGGLGHLLRDLTGEAFIARVDRQVAKRDDAHQAFVAVQHDQPPDLMLLHLARRVADGVVLKAVDDVLRHDVAHLGRVRIPAISRGAHRDVAIGEHPDEPVVLPDRHETAVNVAHPDGRILECRVGADHDEIAGHDLSELHG